MPRHLDDFDAQYERNVGSVIGHLTILEPARRGGERAWACRCSCGTLVTVRHSNIRATRSCGCQRGQVVKHGNARRGQKTPEYRTWVLMRDRCRNPNLRHYERYGGRGIRVCERWQTFENFLADMGLRPSTKHTIDRVDNDGNYEPGNCRWSTRTEQSQNRSVVRLNAEKVLFIREQRALGVSHKTLARHLTVSVSTIKHVDSGRHWRNV